MLWSLLWLSLIHQGFVSSFYQEQHCLGQQQNNNQTLLYFWVRRVGLFFLAKNWLTKKKMCQIQTTCSVSESSQLLTVMRLRSKANNRFQRNCYDYSFPFTSYCDCFDWAPVVASVLRGGTSALLLGSSTTSFGREWGRLTQTHKHTSKSRLAGRAGVPGAIAGTKHFDCSADVTPHQLWLFPSLGVFPSVKESGSERPVKQNHCTISLSYVFIWDHKEIHGGIQARTGRTVPSLPQPFRRGGEEASWVMKGDSLADCDSWRLWLLGGGGTGGDAKLTEGRRWIWGVSGGDNLITALLASFIFIFTPSARSTSRHYSNPKATKHCEHRMKGVTQRSVCRRESTRGLLCNKGDSWGRSLCLRDSKQ